MDLHYITAHLLISHHIDVCCESTRRTAVIEVHSQLSSNCSIQTLIFGLRCMGDLSYTRYHFGSVLGSGFRVWFGHGK
jgi:hypothetical protein